MMTAPRSSRTPPDELRMSFFDHLNELRSRLLKAFIALILGTIVGFFLAGDVMLFLQIPYGDAFITLGPTDSIVAYFRVSLLIGGIIAIPVITYQVLRFVLPGLTPRESRYLLLSLPAITLLFIFGVVFTWFILVPPAIGFFEGFQPTIFRPQWTADLYLGFVTALLFWMGVAFQTPLIFFVVAILGLVKARSLVRNWRIAVVGSAVAAAIITPTIDPVNMILVMGPLMALYVLSIGLVWIGSRINRRSLDDPSAEQTEDYLS
ncbi:MAG: twin-arginine translocase subunit TatC [Candidatus Flexifilum sp.]